MLNFNVLYKGYRDLVETRKAYGFGFLKDEKGIYGIGLGLLVEKEIIDGQSYYIVDNTINDQLDLYQYQLDFLITESQIIYRKDKIFDKTNDFIDCLSLKNTYFLYNTKNLKEYSPFDKHSFSFIQICLSFYQIFETYCCQENKTDFQNALDKQKYIDTMIRKNFFFKFFANIYKKYYKFLLEKNIIDKDFRKICCRLPNHMSFQAYKILCKDFKDEKPLKSVHELFFILKTNEVSKDNFSCYFCKKKSFEEDNHVIYFGLKDNEEYIWIKDEDLEYIENEKIESVRYSKHFSTLSPLSLNKIFNHYNYKLSECNTNDNMYNMLCECKSIYDFRMFLYFFDLFSQKPDLLQFIWSKRKYFSKKKFENGYEYSGQITTYLSSFFKKEFLKKYDNKKLYNEYKKIICGHRKVTQNIDKFIASAIFLTTCFGENFRQMMKSCPHLCFNLIYYDIYNNNSLYAFNDILQGKKIKNILQKIEMNKKISKIDIYKYISICKNKSKRATPNSDFFKSDIICTFIKDMKIYDIKKFFDIISATFGNRMFYNDNILNTEVLKWIHKNIDILHTMLQENRYATIDIMDWILFSLNDYGYEGQLNHNEIPKFTHKMSVAKVIECTTRWHLLKKEKSLTNKRSFHKNLLLEHKSDNFILKALKTENELFEESRVMHHCVHTYTKKVLNGISQIYHVEYNNESATLEVSQSQKEIKIIQLRGIGNKIVSLDLEKKIKHIVHIQSMDLLEKK